MPTFKATIKKDKPRPDKTWLVYIRVTHNRATRYINTSLSVSKKELTSAFKIKNQQVLDSCDDTIREYRKKLLPYGMAVEHMSIARVIEIMTSTNDGSSLSFTTFFEQWYETMKLTRKSPNCYKVAVNSLKKYLKKDDILFSDVTVNMMRKYEQYLFGRSKTPSHYPTYIKFIFRCGREYYNDEDNGVILIPHSLERYSPPKQGVAEKRALDVEVIRKIFDLPYESGEYNSNSRYDFALDCFRMSFCLMGMNAADMYSATEYDGTTLCYNREKTKNKRADKARMEIVVPDVIKPLMERYKGKNHVFYFSERWKSHLVFDNRLALGMVKIAEHLREGRITFYSARHSMATIAVNDAGIDKWTVNDMLCHVDPSLKVTELYIKKSFRPINEANAKLMEFVFGEPNGK